MAKHDKIYLNNVPLRIGIDLGTANLLIYVDQKGVIFNEPSVIAIDYETNETLAVGNEAAKMIGRGHRGLKITSPLNQGVISDMDASEKLLEFAFQKVIELNCDLERSTVLICCPSEVTQVERESLINLAKRLGVEDVFIEEEVKAGGIGAGLDIYSSTGTMVIDIGGGSTDVGVLNLGDIVVSESVRIAGNYFDNEIINFMQFKHGLLVGKRTAERIKIELGTLKKEITDEKISHASGRDLVSGIPKKIEITQTEIRDLLVGPFTDIVSTVLKVLQQTPAELSADIIVNGIVINGGGALIEGVAEFFKEHLTLDIHIAKNPLTAIAEGTRILLQNRGNYFVKPVE